MTYMDNETISLFQDNHTHATETSRIGAEGESLARIYLERHRYRLVMANFKIPVGRNTRGAIVTGEIDLIAYDQDTLCFIEVKTRTSDDFATPESAVDLRKQRQIIRTARKYKKLFHLDNAKVRYDVIAIVLKKGERPKIDLIKDYFREENFRKKFREDYF